MAVCPAYPLLEADHPFTEDLHPHPELSIVRDYTMLETLTISENSPAADRNIFDRSARAFTFRLLGEAEQPVWDRFVDGTYNGTLFHKMRFFSYHPKNRFDFQFLGCFDGERLIAGLPFAIVNGVMRSPVGASFGGLVIQPSSLGVTYQIVKELLAWVEENLEVESIEFTHAPLIYNRHLSQNLDFVLLYCGFKNSQNLFSSAVDLSCLDAEDPYKTMTPAGRRAVRKSFNAELQVVHGQELLPGYYDILVANKAKFGVKPAHTLEELQKLESLFPEALRLFTITDKGNPVAGIYTFSCNSEVLLCFYIASEPAFQQLRPVNRALFEVALWAKRKGYSFLDLGVSMNTNCDNPMEPAWSLVSFKEHTGSKGYLRPSYRFDFKSRL